MSKPGGGPAFPALQVLSEFDDDRGKYIDSYEPVGGMTLRDYFAAKALQGLCADYRANTLMESGVHVHLATHAYALADAMLTARGE